MGVNPNNVVVALASVFVQPWLPGSPATLPADSVTYGAEWGGSWVHVGGTDQGWKTKMSTKTQDITIEEQSTPVDTLADGKTYQVSGTLAEDTLDQMRWSYGGGVLVTQAAASGVIGKKTLSFQDKLDKWAIGFDTINAYGYFRRILIPKAVIADDVETSYRRAADKRMYPFTANSICPVTDILVVEMTAPALP